MSNQPTIMIEELLDQITVLDTIKEVLYKGGIRVGSATSREKISGKTKRRTHEIITIDQSDPTQTVKSHRIQEYDVQVNSVSTPHEHTEVFLAKHRPTTRPKAD